jgi:hypothetical protein
VAKDTVSIVIHGDALRFTNSRVKDHTISFSPQADGSFDVLSADISGVVVTIRGQVGAGVLDADVVSAYCTNHWHLEKPRLGSAQARQSADQRLAWVASRRLNRVPSVRFHPLG